ncbi:unnamed protein product [Rhizoctonia solani]|uniref:Chromatin modification-related protein EAF3 n=1 Tax=Rhizoctonia solani TaxID=456999 RepID=A0A8H3C3P5_9AGAM|nr:unnamed protein product [Rhizoctonia solani]
MPPLGWRKSVDGAKGKKAANQDQKDTTHVFNKPPLVPGITGSAIDALGVTSLGIANPTQNQATPSESNEAMDIDDPSTGDSTPAPGASAIPTGSSSNAEMTPPVRSIKLKLKVKNTKVASPPPERPTGRGRGRGRGRGGRGSRGGRGRGGRGRKIASPSVSPEEESPVEEPGSPESEESSAMGEDEFPRADFEDVPEQPEEGDTMMDADGEEDGDGEIDADGEAEIDPDVTVDSDEELLLDMDMPDQTIPDSDADPDMSMMSMSSKRLTARQAAMITGGADVNHVMLPEATGRKAPKTEAEIALRRSETARKRKHQDAQRLEDEKTETINRLLKKQSARARNKKILDTPILKTETATEANPHPKTGCTGLHYLVHYKGWKQSWDEWVPPPRLLKWNDTNLTIQKNLVAQTKQAGPGAGASNKAAGASSGGGMGTGGRGAGRKEGRKRGREEDEAAKKPEMKLEIPDILKVQLVDDWEAMTKSNRLVPLPRTPSVQDILTSFKEWLPTVMPSSKHRVLATVLPVIIAGLQLYFDKSGQIYCIGLKERREPRDMSTIYGAEHLLRLIVNLPSMISQTTMDTESVALLKEYVEYLLQYLVQERERIFLKEYEHASPHYQNISRA